MNFLTLLAKIYNHGELPISMNTKDIPNTVVSNRSNEVASEQFNKSCDSNNLHEPPRFTLMTSKY